MSVKSEPFSATEDPLELSVTVGAAKLSVIVIVVLWAPTSTILDPVTLEISIITVSLPSYKLLSTVLSVTLPVVSPASITIFVAEIK